MNRQQRRAREAAERNLVAALEAAADRCISAVDADFWKKAEYLNVSYDYFEGRWMLDAEHRDHEWEAEHGSDETYAAWEMATFATKVEAKMVGVLVSAKVGLPLHVHDNRMTEVYAPGLGHKPQRVSGAVN